YFLPALRFLLRTSKRIRESPMLSGNIFDLKERVKFCGYRCLWEAKSRVSSQLATLNGRLTDRRRSNSRKLSHTKPGSRPRPDKPRHSKNAIAWPVTFTTHWRRGLLE